MNKKSIIIISIFLILLSACGIGSAAKETRLSTNTADQWNPSIWSNYVVWQDARNGGSDIYLTDMSKKVQTRITKGVDAENPCVAGTKIVWSDNRNKNWDVYMYDIKTKKTTRITSDKYDQTKPATYDKYIVWLDGSKGYDDVCLYDMTTKKVTRLTSGTYVENVEIYGNKIAWSNYYSGTMYDIKTKKTVSVCDPYPYILDIYSTKILYYNNYDEPRLCMYDYSNDKITDMDWLDRASDMYSNKLVYTDTRNGNMDVYMAQF